ncbi:putative membrane metal-binding protein [Microbacterium resistens]|uniref:Membrane metal-binding protein n=2 Tax=Microbacterium resistens TaxID=156977 RepID=A0ABU1SBY3_9MICO|nr:putative membrane metal-binding protein [Microbacterium resistens]
MKWIRRFLWGLPAPLILLLLPLVSSMPFSYWNVLAAILAMIIWMVSQEFYERRARRRLPDDTPAE